jgi:hypothetical protein
VALDVIRFDVNEGGDAVLDARWTLLAGSSDRLLASRREWIEAPSGDAADPAKRVTALREAVAMLGEPDRRGDHGGRDAGCTQTVSRSLGRVPTAARRRGLVLPAAALA